MSEKVSFGPWEVTQESILKYAEGISDTNPRHTDPSREDFCAPPMYSAVFIIPGTAKILFEKDLGLNVSKLVHGGIDIRFERLLHPGDSVTLYARLDSVEDKGSGKLVNITFSGVDSEGTEVVSGITRYFVRGDKKGQKSGTKEAAEQEREPDLTGTLVVAEDQPLKYADGSGDRFPIHTDDNFARSVGLPGIILHGMCTLAFASRIFIDKYLKGDSSRFKRIGVRFSRYVLPRDELTLKAWKTGEEEGKERFSYIMVNQKGEKVLDEGVAEVVP